MSSSSDFLKDYELAEPTIRGLYDSKLRLAIIDALKDGPMRLADLRRVVGSNAPNTSTKAKDLENLGIIERVDGDFQLTPYGKAVRQRAQESFEFYATYAKFKEFWKNHDTSGIPEHLWMRIGELNNSVLVRDTTTNVTESHDKFVDLLGTIKQKFYGISPIYHDEYMEMLLAAINKGANVKIITNREILNLLKTIRINLKKDLRKVSNRVEWLVYEKHLSVAYTVSEGFSSLALGNKNDPTHYLDMDLQSTDPRAIKWGLDLFEYYKKQAKPIKLSDYLQPRLRTAD